VALDELAQARLEERQTVTKQCKTCRLVAAGLETDDSIRRWTSVLSASEVARLLQQAHGELAPADTTLRRHLRECA
jgi:hypothetical protein